MPDNLQGLDDVIAPVITAEMRAFGIARVMREIDSELLMSILGLGE